MGASLRRKFPRWVVGIAVLGLLAANTFNVGADLGAVAVGGALLSRGALQALWLVVPVALLLAIPILTGFATYAIKEFLGLGQQASAPTNFLRHPHAGHRGGSADELHAP